jgi:hypothetical protein
VFLLTSICLSAAVPTSILRTDSMSIPHVYSSAVLTELEERGIGLIPGYMSNFIEEF